MPLRCLLFSSDETMSQPIWQVLTDLGIEGEYCRNAVEAVERVTTQLFQIVITDWDDQPEAAFLLKTARDLKAANRPLTLAIVREDASLPQALQAGANSVLRKPIQTELVRDTLSTACELLRAKVESTAVAAQRNAAPPQIATGAAAAAPAPIKPVTVTQLPEKAFRAGEFLQPGSADRTARLDTELEVRQTENSESDQVEVLNELEPMAAAMETPPVKPADRVEEKPSQPRESLQDRLRRVAADPLPAPSAENKLLGFSETPSYSTATGAQEHAGAVEPEAAEGKIREAKAEAALFSYITGETKNDKNEKEDSGGEKRRRLPGLGKILLAGALATACTVTFLKVPRTQWPQNLRLLATFAMQTGRSWLHPQAVTTAQTPTQHENFGRAGDEYKLPVVGNIPDATTDPSQIQVLPIVDPTVKPAKGAETTPEQPQSSGNPNDTAPVEQNQTAPPVTEQNSVVPEAEQNPAVNVRPANESTTSAGLPNAAATAPQLQTNVPVTQQEVPAQRPPAPVVPSAPKPRPSSPPNAGNIPSSLKSQVASMTPEASGSKPLEAALPSIGPVNLPETVARGLISQQVDPVYPDSASTKRLQGSVVLQVLIAQDGTVQEAKFLQGSLMFARAAIDAVRQWRFKPYIFNGRPVPAQTTLTLNFKPAA